MARFKQSTGHLLGPLELFAYNHLSAIGRTLWRRVMFGFWKLNTPLQLPHQVSAKLTCEMTKMCRFYIAHV
jgi:hypothetical protein